MNECFRMGATYSKRTPDGIAEDWNEVAKYLIYPERVLLIATKRSKIAGHLNLSMDGNSADLFINGKHFQVTDLPADTTLNSFIREHAHLRGTKFMCLEGGCGACVVSATTKQPDGSTTTLAINSCLVPVYACHGWSIETVEALGNRKNGYGKVQATLASNNGTQCGYCSPGMVMNMYSLLKGKAEFTMKDVENSFGGNICRCTGYRPILDAFKSLASDASKELKQKCTDLEDLSMVCLRNNKECSITCAEDWCHVSKIDTVLLEKQLKLKLSDGSNWYRVSQIKHIFEVFSMIENYSYILVGGKTSHGVYRVVGISNYIDVNGVAELHFKNVSSDSIELGPNISLTNAMECFYSAAKLHSDKFNYTKLLADHIDLIANVPVRNVGTVAGNLSIKNKHNEFPSDLFTILEGVGAQLTIGNINGTSEDVPLMEYLSIDMNKKVMLKITLPALDNSYIFKSYKIMPRAQNAHAYVNAAFLFKVDRNDKFRVLEKPNIVFGGIASQFVHATKTESYLQGKQLLDNDTIQQALDTLSSELNPEFIPPDASAEYKKGLGISLFYKFILSLSPDNVSPKNRSGGELLQRPLSSGKQDFDTDKNLWPLNKPMPKLEAHAQCAGEAEYVNDIKKIPNELFGAVVVAKRATASSFKLNPSEALKMPGVVAFYSAKDIPGANDFMSPKIVPEMGFLGEEIFASKKILFAGQALGIIIAETHTLALEAADQVKVDYIGVKKPQVDFIDVINAGIKDRIIEQGKINPTVKKDDVKHKASGRLLLRSQYHYTMETQSCVCIPSEEGLDVYPSTQWPAAVQGTISNMLNISENSVTVSVRRLGGAYGAKISRNTQVSAICGLAAYLSNCPVRLTLSLETNMQMIGKRFPCYLDYEVKVNDNGQIQHLNAKLYQDVGATLNEKDIISGTLAFLGSTYDIRTWSVVGYSVRTDTPSNTWARAPGSTEAACCVEVIMEHIANVVKKDPVAVKLSNIITDQNPLVKLIDDLKSSSDYEKRLAVIKSFNSANRWKKRGISLTPLIYPLSYFGRYHATVTVFGNGGSVAISHGGIECGQGINTKAAQACAHVLGIPLDAIKVIPTISFISPNNSTTGGSQTSEAVTYAVTQASQELLKRLEPIRAKLPPGTGWVDLIRKASTSDVDLKASYMYKSVDLKAYNIYAAAVSEVEIDILTGQTQVSRVDVVEDAGQSLSPEIDVGQVEGAFVMGLGYYLTENLVYDKETGKLLTDRTWNYKPPGAKDIPVNFQIQLQRNSRNPFGVLRSKATGEPPLNLSCSVTFAIRNALKSARKDSGKVEDWFDIDYPVTPEQIWLHGLTDKKSMTL